LSAQTNRRDFLFRFPGSQILRLVRWARRSSSTLWSNPRSVAWRRRRVGGPAKRRTREHKGCRLLRGNLDLVVVRGEKRELPVCPRFRWVNPRIPAGWQSARNQ
jgi:hypothetical protein